MKVRGGFMRIASAALLVAVVASGQTTPVRVETRDEAMARLKNLKPDPVADRAKRQELARQFATETEKSKKMMLAVQLRLLGDTNPIYFDYLEPFARDAVENVGPDPYPFGVEWPKGKPPELTPEYVRWRAARGIDPTIDPVLRLREYLSDFFPIVWCGDPKARPLLLEALRSENGALVGSAITGLLNLGGTDDIETIVQAIRSAPLAARRVHYLTMEHQPQFLTAAGTARFEAALSVHDPEGLAIFRERRRYMDKLRLAEKDARK